MAYNPKTWTEGTVVKPARVVIDGVEHEVLPEERTGATPLTPDDMNRIEQGITNIGSLEDLSTTEKNNLVAAINEIAKEEYKEGTNLIISSSNITPVNVYYKRYGKIVTLKFSFHATSNITNGTVFATLNIPPSKTGFYSVIRSAASGQIGAVNLSGRDNLELTASGTITYDDWYTIAATYVSA